MNVEDCIFKYQKKYNNIDEFRVALGEIGEILQLNMADNWEQITQDVWDNEQNCTCQVRKVQCPCQGGLDAAYEGGECHCGLFKGN